MDLYSMSAPITSNIIFFSLLEPGFKALNLTSSLFCPSATAMPLNETPRAETDCPVKTNKSIIAGIYFLIFPFALVLNGTAAWVSLHLKPTSTFMVYLKNLIAADIIMTIIIPILALKDLMQTPPIVLVSCMVGPIFYSTLYTCITFLCLISVDRFLKIMIPPGKQLGQSVAVTKLISVAVWVILFGSSGLPNIILSNNMENITELTSCMSLKGPVGLEAHERIVIYLNFLFWLLSVVVAVCYICITNKVIRSFKTSGSNNNQGKKKTKLRVFLVVIVFFVSFAPYHIVRIPYTFMQVSSSSQTGCLQVLAWLAKESSLLLATSNICMNPLLYVFLCREFEAKLMEITKNVTASLHNHVEVMMVHFQSKSHSK